MRMKMVVMLILAGAMVAACSAPQLYATGRNAQKSECMKRADSVDRERCLRDADLSYDAYRRGIADGDR